MDEALECAKNLLPDFAQVYNSSTVARVASKTLLTTNEMV